MQAIVANEECEVDPTPQWIRDTLSHITAGVTPEEQFLCLLRGTEDQMHALAVDGAFTLEWYDGSRGGHLAGYRTGAAPPALPSSPGFFARLFGAAKPRIHGSRFSLEETARALDLYAAGAETLPGLDWVTLR